MTENKQHPDSSPTDPKLTAEEKVTLSQEPAEGPDAAQENLVIEIANMLKYFAKLRKEVSKLYLRQNNRGLLENVTAQLEAVLGSSDVAFAELISVLEEVNEQAATLQASADNAEQQLQAQNIRNLVVRGIEVCTLQDVAGQRIARIILSLKFVEECVDRLATSIGRRHVEELSARWETDSYNAPGIIGRGDTGISQKEVDRLFDVLERPRPL
ncbi:MAG: hypothetical protein K0U36_07310 [Alphaproteobacteria bacterium]|nr:hypothetical protein [Alphaproteobacteria bacterium]